jgi:hypothetical protein
MASKSEDSMQEAKVILCLNPSTANEWARDTLQIGRWMGSWSGLHIVAKKNLDTVGISQGYPAHRQSL